MLNGIPVTLDAFASLQFKAGVIVSHIVHWHEAPVKVLMTIGVQRVELSQKVMAEYNIHQSATIFVCNQPSSVPVHPAGSYLSNLMAVMVESQEGLECQSLIVPIKTIDPANRVHAASKNGKKLKSIF